MAEHDEKTCPICHAELIQQIYPCGIFYQCPQCVYYFYIMADSLKKVIGDKDDRF